MLKEIILKTLLPTVIGYVDNGTLDSVLISIRADYLDNCNEGETIEFMQTMEKIKGIDVGIVNVVALNEDCQVRLIKSFTIKELIELIKGKI